MRETLYNWIGPAIKGTRVLDLFGGTGALGFEAASRGAGEVVIVERDSRVLAAIRALQGRLRADTIRLMAGDAMHAIAQLRRAGAPFDLVLLDPPFGEGLLARVLPELEPLMAPSAMLYLEAESAVSAEQLQSWLPNRTPSGQRQGRAGQVYYHLFEF